MASFPCILFASPKCLLSYGAPVSRQLSGTFRLKQTKCDYCCGYFNFVSPALRSFDTPLLAEEKLIFRQRRDRKRLIREPGKCLAACIPDFRKMQRPKDMSVWMKENQAKIRRLPDSVSNCVKDPYHLCVPRTSCT